jgi:16S rRNA (adenine1518-N6/adenine1519-N6)-dimethyltransferase
MKNLTTGGKIYAKKSLGQNFLTSQGALKKIVEAGMLTEKSTVLEIGPGKGALTVKLLESGATVIAVEKDHDLIPVLEELFAPYIKQKKFFLHEGDILTINLKKIGIGGKKSPYTVIANIPYYITGEIIRLFLEAQEKPETIVFLVQKEVAERIVKKDTKESILSLSIQAYGEAHYIATVPRGAFVPAPNVDSAIIQIKNVSAKNFKNKTEEDHFFQTVKAGFKAKRKKMISNLHPLYPKETLTAFFKKNSIDPNIRPERIPLPIWLALSKLL